MDAVVITGPYKVEVRACPVPTMQAPTDAIVKIELCGLCGSDLHPFRGKEPVDPGTIMGHEFVGTVVETGSRWRLRHWCLFPEGVSDEAAMLAGDILSTGYFCARNARLQELAPDSVVAVIGAGPVGLLAAVSAMDYPTVGRVLVLDRVAGRLEVAKSLGAVPIDISSSNAVETVRDLTGGQGAAAVLEVVGAGPALRLAYDILRPGGVISSVGCHTDPEFPFAPSDLYNKNVTLVSGRCPARSCMDDILPALQQGGLQHCTKIITHKLPLKEAVEAYAAFESQATGWVKVCFDPWA
ncbi:hypothetical protein QBZ16_004759 [Prototheca wickerhamii]|uniref:Alcohol dehydrogenase n=1 Tax=Prototheca wickerhamii TaxID=3111 RepID=A0AAD9IH49_PROWI|nr:hypothetical protein QBZ16_004759 [Prototheca wickerhamii]